MKKSTLYITILCLMIWSCEDEKEASCKSCGLEIYSDNLLEFSDGHYILEYDEGLSQTYTALKATTNCGLHTKISWDTDYQYQIQTDWVSLVNPASMTDEDGNAQIIFAAWEPFIGYTIEVFGGYTDDCGVHHSDSIKITIVNEETP